MNRTLSSYPITRLESIDCRCLNQLYYKFRLRRNSDDRTCGEGMQWGGGGGGGGKLAPERIV